MKTILIFFGLALLVTTVTAQTKGSAKLYGFKQSVAGGKAPEISSGPGARASSGGGKNYFLYALSSSRIYPSEMWIEGNHYGVDLKIISTTPVEYIDDLSTGSPKKVMVPKTAQKVIQLITARAVQGKTESAKAKSLSATNEMVIVYKQGSKFYYATRKMLSELDGAAMQ